MYTGPASKGTTEALGTFYEFWTQATGPPRAPANEEALTRRMFLLCVASTLKVTGCPSPVHTGGNMEASRIK